MSPDNERPLKILIAADTFAPDVNGAARFTAELAAGLVRRGHDVRVMAPANRPGPGVFVEEHAGAAMTVHRIYSWRWYPHDWLRFALPWRSQQNAAKVLDDFRPDVVHIQSHIVIGRGLARQAAQRGIRIVATNHFMPENMLEHTLLPQFLRATAVRMAWADAAKTYQHVESITTPTRRAAEFLEAATDVTDVHAVSCGIRASDYTPDLEQRTGNRILFVGRVTGEKNIDQLLSAVAELDPALDARLEIVGGGDQLENLKRMAKQLGIDDRTVFTGYVTDDELKQAYTRATVFAMPSTAELQSIATMEAMASGLPIVAADAMALPHLVHDGQNGYLFEPGDVPALAARLTEVLTASERKLTALKRNSLAFIQPHDIDRTLSTFEALYRGLRVEDPVTDIEPVATAED
ncbi:glycosyltransferase [Arenivirga flava]|uniref:D-inositol 3-phosphate glycosyltransferase n=1 Tax=Arenivirga flava TaxID=1930060 RepID=A0AA37XBQ2_9MICO|nr:glycosyltransferase [Arenivirga flava]GMA27722.1 hypothetical protein GCM10025874_09750 [Arenivirga flava]